ncbi:cilia- and flagella-associated protein 100-like isoform X1 [Hypomesus transpacificus]|uniref:cilia- and flagella-associated protein 100-like isoform X1 n=1 Tax=Hypomesus transpacificus TaxID=137520 RepID=UPI001F0843A3|nr:cilia- and flagella-associated protein 100-like isoform X1 [Hypomesus transpacificus]
MAKIISIRSDISKYQEILKEYQIYKKFLTSVAPAEWRKDQKLKKEKRVVEQWGKPNKDKQSLTYDKKVCLTGRRYSKVTKITQTRHQRKSGKECAGRQESITEVIEPSDSDEEPELYFTDPREMLHILTDLEEQNLSFIQNFQETEEARDEICKTVQLMQNKTANETQVLQQQIDILNNTIQREEEKNSDLELKSKIFSYGEYRADKQDHMLKLLHNKMKEVFKMCGGEVGTQFSTLHMLANIESRMEEVLERLDTLPSENVEAIRTAKEKEKRLMMREEKMEMKKRHHEERLKIAIERATSDSKKQTGRKLMPRSEPSEVKKNKVYVMSSKEQEDALYFFT